MEEQQENLSKVDLSHVALISSRIANEVNPEVTELSPGASELDAKSRIGYHLARIVLAIICIFLIFLILYILFEKPVNVPKIDLAGKGSLTDSAAFNRNFRLIQLAQENNKASRDFIIQISQMVLLNMLLPILTAILGYIFGSHSENKG